MVPGTRNQVKDNGNAIKPDVRFLFDCVAQNQRGVRKIFRSQAD